MALQLPEIPPVLKPIQHFLKVANEHERRDPVVTYWARLYALQTGLGIDKSSESLAVLLPLMDWLEGLKKQAGVGNEAITNDVVAQAHVENYANRLFLWADKQDRAAVFNKNVVKAFYTAGVIFDVCETFGELSIEVQEQRKYAKWKAAYIHTCLKNGEQPVPGPVGGEEDEGLSETGGDGGMGAPADQPGPSHSQPQQPYQPPQPPQQPYQPPQEPYQPPQQPYFPPAPAPAAATPSASSSAVNLNFDQIAKAQKYSKLAYSALNYEDVPTAVTNLQKALHLLQTGHDS